MKVDLGQKKGKIVVEFASMEDLERILGTLAPGEGRVLKNGLAEDSTEDEAAEARPRARPAAAVSAKRAVSGMPGTRPALCFLTVSAQSHRGYDAFGYGTSSWCHLRGGGGPCDQ